MIKINDTHVFDTPDNGGRVHIYRRGSAHPLCGAGLRRKNNTTSNDAKGSECCTNCLRIARKRGLIEEVSDKPVQDPIKAKLHEYECRAKAAELRAANDELNEDDAKQAELVCRLGREVEGLKAQLLEAYKKPCSHCNPGERMKTFVGVDIDEAVARVCQHEELKETVKRLERANHHQQDNLDKLEKAKRASAERWTLYNDEVKKREAYEQATNGHAVENIKTIMQAMPSPEELEGYELRWGMPKKGESFVEALKGQTLWGVATADFDNPMARWLIRTPIIEYIPTEEITDELCEELGRIECEVRTTYEEEWLPSKLLAVWSGHQFPYSVKGGVVHYRHCRIKRSTIDKSRAKRNIAK